MKDKKTNSRIIAHIILFIILGIPLFFFNPNRAEQIWYIQLFETAWRLFAMVLVGSIAGFVLSGIVYICGNIYSWYLGMIDKKMEKSMEFEQQWDFKKVMDFIFNPCWVFAMIAIYVSYFFIW